MLGAWKRLNGSPRISTGTGKPRRARSSCHLWIVSARARTLASALDEFVTIKRHVELGAWKAARLAPLERRVLAGETLVVRFVEADQAPEIVGHNRDCEWHRALEEQYRAEFFAANPKAKSVKLNDEQKAEIAWAQAVTWVRLRVETKDLDCDLEEALGLTTLKDGENVIVAPRLMIDSRLPVDQQYLFTPTPKKLLYGTRAKIVSI